MIDVNKIKIKDGISNNIIDDVQYLHKTIWGLDSLEMTPSHIYVATQHNGGKVLCAYYENKPIGFVFGFPSVDDNGKVAFYSHNLGVLKKFRNYGIGFLLKKELRRVLLNLNYKNVYWTFEPLDSKNAYSYIHKLGCVSNSYQINYYGEMRDSINKKLPSDRLIMNWRIASSHVDKAIKNSSKNSINEINDGIRLNFTKELLDTFLEPIEINGNNFEFGKNSDLKFYLEIPINFPELKKSSPKLALKWKLHVREIMTKCFANNLYIIDVIYDQQKFFFIFANKNKLTKYWR
ncbi:MAG: GNAT family N-acetyltransferase [Candidatus Marinimicrobia bacterium]|nr:GNAT family N-acetyltransferase [Candidatus Neomarinimicrobiota bacterium]